MNLTPVALMEGTCFAVCSPEILTITSVFVSMIMLSHTMVHSLILFCFDIVYSISLLCCLQNTVFGGKPTAPDYNHIACAVFWYCHLFP